MSVDTPKVSSAVTPKAVVVPKTPPKDPPAESAFAKAPQQLLGNPSVNPAPTSVEA